MEINKIHCMDCLEGLKEIEDNSVDLIVTDPPYGINYHSHYYKNGNPHTPIVNDDTLFLPLDELWRILKPTGAMFVFFSHKNPLVDKRIKNTIIWVKNNWSAGDLFGDNHCSGQILRNCVHPKLGLHVFNCAFKVKQKVLGEVSK